MMGAKNHWHELLHQVSRDLMSFPGRLAIAWRIGLLCTVMAFVAMLYGIPESAISCYLILFVMKPDSAESMVMAFAVTLLISIVVGLLFIALPLTLAFPLLRMVLLTVTSIFFLWLGSASKLGPVGSIIALVIAFVMSLLGNAPDGELAARTVLYAWLMATSPMILLIIFTLFLGRASVKLLCQSLSKRLESAAQALREPDTRNLAVIQEQLLDGQKALQEQVMLIRIFRLCPLKKARWLEAAVYSSYRLLLATSALAPTLPTAERSPLADTCETIAQQIICGSEEKKLVPVGTSELHNTLQTLVTPVKGDIPVATNSAFFAENAFTSPEHIRFALKATAGSLICYFIYTALNWQDIHTAMITCYVVALSTTGETVHKLALRIIGCLIGAMAGVLSLIYLFPLMTDIGQLMVMIFLMLTLAAWISSGNERIAYAGIQIGLAFLLCVLHGSKPAIDLGVAYDRVIGILLGNLVIYIIFTCVWPVSVANAVRSHIASALASLSILANSDSLPRATATREAGNVEEALARAHEALMLAFFEPVSLRPTPGEYARFREQMAAITALCPILFLPAEVTNSGRQQHIRRLEELTG
ncbi:MAG: fusaric acid resistance protein [Proteobacteria bacterium]|nr:fusaric acid resistance protein [Pseudomonadota bacterium]